MCRGCGPKKTKKKNDTNEIIYKRKRLLDIENKPMVTKGDGGGAGINEEFGINVYIPLHIK